jgi:hypothetical protein
MTILHSTTGHSAKGERKIAGLIYLFVGIAICFSIILFFMLGSNKSLSPNKASDSKKSAPDSTPGTRVNPSTVPPPDSNPKNTNPSD